MKKQGSLAMETTARNDRGIREVQGNGLYSHLGPNQNAPNATGLEEPTRIEGNTNAVLQTKVWGIL